MCSSSCDQVMHGRGEISPCLAAYQRGSLLDCKFSSFLLLFFFIPSWVHVFRGYKLTGFPLDIHGIKGMTDKYVFLCRDFPWWKIRGTIRWLYIYLRANPGSFPRDASLCLRFPISRSRWIFDLLFNTDNLKPVQKGIVSHLIVNPCRGFWHTLFFLMWESPKYVSSGFPLGFTLTGTTYSWKAGRLLSTTYLKRNPGAVICLSKVNQTYDCNWCIFLSRFKGNDEMSLLLCFKPWIKEVITDCADNWAIYVIVILFLSLLHYQEVWNISDVYIAGSKVDEMNYRGGFHA